MRRCMMWPEQPAADVRTAASRLAVTFADLFDQLGTSELRYSPAAQQLSGRDIVIDGFLSHAHGPEPTLSLVDQLGACPDCSPVPVATIALPGARAPMRAGDDGVVRVIGKLEYG